ncbi:MAG: septal ring lytic transglycosylase RlpA family protein [Melioribacteraceae bacterium]|nr:septal ring lytic transglycosylase RlpA family protein [Melioribacteraceae bacterium]
MINFSIIRDIKIRRLIVVSLLAILTIGCSSVDRYSEYKDVEGKIIERGIASWYGPNFHGKLTANGEIYDMYELTAAHKTLPFNSIVKVLNLSNGKSVIVRINDRGPFVKNRIIDLSKKAAQEVDMIQSGYTEVELRLLSKVGNSSSRNHSLYTIQIGSYKRKRDAEKFGSKFDKSKVVMAEVNDNIYYRVYYGEYKNKNEAEYDIKLLKKEGVDCFIKKLN